MFEAPSGIEDLNGSEETENTQANSDAEADVNFNRESIGKRAIEDLASQLNKAANTIRDFSQNVSLFYLNISQSAIMRTGKQKMCL